ncbi:MAG: hypothetical protein QXN15_02810 [Candidatus Jordarchaeales archaeon]|nr:hypothetical protein [Candidatus Jordarchaeia archaeon]
MTEIIRAVKFGYEITPEIKRLLYDFRDMINFCLNKAFETNSFSIKALHHACYNELKPGTTTTANTSSRRLRLQFPCLALGRGQKESDQ